MHMQLNTHKLVVRGRSKDGFKSYALPLGRQELQEFGLADDPQSVSLIVKVTNEEIVVRKAE